MADWPKSVNCLLKFKVLIYIECKDEGLERLALGNVNVVLGRSPIVF